MDFGERNDSTWLEIGQKLVGRPELLPLNATPTGWIWTRCLLTEDLKTVYPEAERALISYSYTHTFGEDKEDACKELEKPFPALLQAILSL